jgi:voltage-gated potassium channel
MNEPLPEKPSVPTVLAKKEFFRFSMRQFLIALIGLVVTYPFISNLNNGELIENLLMMALLISAVVAVGGRRRLLTILLVIPALVGPWLDRYWHGLVPAWLITGTHMVFAGFVINQLIRFILRETHVNAEVLCAGISAYVMLAIFFTPAYLMVSQLNPASFSGTHMAANQSLTRFDALYFSFVSLTCVGCNDITALSKAARMLIMVESTTGVLCLTVLIARLVALYSHLERSDREKPAATKN